MVGEGSAIKVGIGEGVPGAQPGQVHSHILVKGVAGNHAGQVVVQDGVAAHGAVGEVGQREGQKTHADGQIGLRHDPVDVHVLGFHVHAVGAHGAAAAAAGFAPAPGVAAAMAPVDGADFKLHGTAQLFGGHEVDLETQALRGVEVFFRAVEAFIVAGVVTVGAGVIEAGVAVPAESKVKIALDLDVRGVGAGSGADHHGHGHHNTEKLFHSVYPSYFCKLSV